MFEFIEDPTKESFEIDENSQSTSNYTYQYVDFISVHPIIPFQLSRKANNELAGTSLITNHHCH